MVRSAWSGVWSCAFPLQKCCVIYRFILCGAAIWRIEDELRPGRLTALFRNPMITLSLGRSAHHADAHPSAALQHRRRRAFQTLRVQGNGAMPRRQVWIVTVLVVILVWSTVMTVLGQLEAVAALLPSLGLLVQQIVSAHSGPQTSRTREVECTPPAQVGSEEPLR